MTQPVESHFQYSWKAGEDILLVRGNSLDELKDNVKAVHKELDELATLVVEMKQLMLGKSVVGTGVVGTPDSAPRATQVATPPPGPGGNPSCKHGPREYKTGAKAQGGSWKAWFCPTPKGTPDQCEPEWVR